MSRAALTTIGVLVVGLPSSGNRLIASTVRRCGAAAAGIEHGLRSTKGFEPTKRSCEKIQKVMPADVWYAVMPVRSLSVWRKATAERFARGNYWGFKSAREAALASRRFVVQALAAIDVPLVTVSYEGMVADPEGCQRELCGLLGLEYVPVTNPLSEAPWTWDVYDGNAKYVSGTTP